MKEFGEWIIDVPFILMSLVVTATLYRAFSMWSCVSKEPVLSKKRAQILSSFIALLLDPVLVISVVLIFIHHRYFSQFWSTLKGLSGYQKHFLCLKTLNQVAYDTFIYDIPTVFSMTILYGTLWRVAPLRRELAQLPPPITLEKYRNVHLLHLACWVFDPFMIICYGLLHLGWSVDEMKQKLIVRTPILDSHRLGSSTFRCTPYYF
jgi:hypothetical protein